MEVFAIIFSAIFVNNFVLSRFLGICPFLGVSKKVETAMGMGAAVIFVMTLASAATFLINHAILIPLGVEFLSTVSFILIIAGLVQFIEIFLKKSSPSLYQALGVFLPLITTNCAVLGVTIINLDEGYSFLMASVHGAAGGVGFMLAIVLFASLRERLEKADILPDFQGVPAALLTAGLMSIAFMGFTGII